MTTRYAYMIIQKKVTDVIYDITFKDLNTNEPIDLTDCTVYITIKTGNDNSIDDSTALIAKTITSHKDAINGITSFSITHTESNLTPNDYYIDIKLYKGSQLLSSKYWGIYRITNTTQNSLY